MAGDEFRGEEKARFPALLLVGLALGAVVIVVAFIVDSEFGIPVLILAAICAAAAVGYRVIAGSNRSDADSADNVPKQPARSEGPLGGSPEAHDDLSPHDIPADNPAHTEAEKLRSSDEGTLRPPLQ